MYSDNEIKKHAEMELFDLAAKKFIYSYLSSSYYINSNHSSATY